ncbi:response regulator [Ascidiaceihabitans sp.]|uniref:response regulator n=1 Tax=Ascidiaceihabitans sp. TaxID=1872644 RepID=UPI0032988FF3
MQNKMNISLVDDDDFDAEFLQRSLKKSDFLGTLTRTCNGLDALEILNNHCAHGETDHPFTILLDINMPRMDGHEFLTELRQNQAVANSRVIVLTTSGSEADIGRAYEKHVFGYIVKPHGIKEMDNVVQALTAFWDTCKHPKHPVLNIPHVQIHPLH